jgi:uncharacterized protein (DUF1330 family)
MAAYLIVVRESPIRDHAAMETYRQKVGEMTGDYKLIPLAANGTLHALEGTLPDSVIIVQFPTVEDAKAWYGSPEYQAAAPHRQRAGDYRVMIVEGL